MEKSSKFSAIAAVIVAYTLIVIFGAILFITIMHPDPINTDGDFRIEVVSSLTILGSLLFIMTRKKEKIGKENDRKNHTNLTSN